MKKLGSRELNELKTSNFINRIIQTYIDCKKTIKKYKITRTNYILGVAPNYTHQDEIIFELMEYIDILKNEIKVKELEKKQLRLDIEKSKLGKK